MRFVSPSPKEILVIVSINIWGKVDWTLEFDALGDTSGIEMTGHVSCINKQENNIVEEDKNCNKTVNENSQKIKRWKRESEFNYQE